MRLKSVIMILLSWWKKNEQDNINCLLLELKDEVIRDYLDFKPFLDLYRKEVREAIKEGHFYGK